MAKLTPKIGFSYFSAKDYLLNHHLQIWLPAIKNWGGSFVTLSSNFDLAIPEDVFINVINQGLEPIVHFNTLLPTARTFNESAFILDLYRKWGASLVILGDRPNTKLGWPLAGWHDESLVENFLDRLIPLANHAVKIGLTPVLPPLEPGGDYWDCAFIERVLDGLKARQLNQLLDILLLSSFGFTYGKPLSWGEGGPQRWPGSKPYYTPDGQEDQLGFHNFEWLQAASQRITGKRMPVIILDAGRPETVLEPDAPVKMDDSLREIIRAYYGIQDPASNGTEEMTAFNELVMGCAFSLDTMKNSMANDFSMERLNRIFLQSKPEQYKNKGKKNRPKQFEHYLLLPSYAAGVSDAVLNKVRPLIKKYRPTVGFSFEEALCASKVSVFPDPYLFTNEQINQLKEAGCEVEILPQSGIEIATLLQD